jgi:2-amino-4-hydroxy-6-hydroxymethyldihydropteridine diphosphokinase
VVKAFRYLIALGSNVRHPRIGHPRKVLVAALEELDRKGIELIDASPVIESDPIGPSMRRYANGVALVSSKLEPDELLARLKHIERKFGRRSGGQRWRARVLDLDIVLWSGGILASDDLVIPHPLFRERSFVLGPANTIAGDWRDPLTGLSVRQLTARLTRCRPLPR